MTTPVMAYPQFAPSEQDAYREQFDAGLQALPAGLVVKARQLLDKLSPVEWPVEWHLPWWLGQELRAVDAVRADAYAVQSLWAGICPDRG